MKARIGVADSSKVIEIDIEDPIEFRSTVEEALVSSEDVMWVTDSKKRIVGVPTARIAFVEVETDESTRSVGFAP